jgi:uncharacterized membrane protein HdeD (DUF308 family)
MSVLLNRLDPRGRSDRDTEPAWNPSAATGLELFAQELTCQGGVMATNDMLQDGMLQDLRRNWGWIVVRGVAGVIFGVLAFIWPAITLAVLVLFWGAYALADGVLALIAAFRVRDRGKPFWALLIVGVLGVAAGLLTFFWPGVTALALLAFIAAWALLMGIFQIVAAIRLRKAIQHEWLLALSGVLSVIFGALMLWNPGAGALAVIWVVASYAIVFGLLLIALGFRLKGRSPSGLASPV